MKNVSKNTYKRNTYLNLAFEFVSSLLNKIHKQLVMSPKSLSHAIESAAILSKDCFAACEGLATFLSFDLLLKSYKNVCS